MKRVEIQIDELVLQGFAAADRFRIADAVKRELARLVTERGIEQRAASSPKDAGAFRVATNANADTIGRQAAQSIHRRLAGKTRR